MITIMEIWSKSYSEATGVKFYSMHPGWADTPAVRESMPDFYNRMKNKLRSEDEGADTLVYLAVCNKLTPEMNGQFFEGRSFPLFFLICYFQF